MQAHHTCKLAENHLVCCGVLWSFFGCLFGVSFLLFCCSVVCCGFVWGFVYLGFLQGVEVSFRTEHLIKIIQDTRITYREDRNRERRRKEP